LDRNIRSVGSRGRRSISIRRERRRLIRIVLGGVVIDAVITRTGRGRVIIMLNG
jgi:hypothetical protein